jgi:hypothetical protein
MHPRRKPTLFGLAVTAAAALSMLAVSDTSVLGVFGAEAEKKEEKKADDKKEDSTPPKDAEKKDVEKKEEPKKDDKKPAEAKKEEPKKDDKKPAEVKKEEPKKEEKKPAEPKKKVLPSKPPSLVMDKLLERDHGDDVHDTAKAWRKTDNSFAALERFYLYKELGKLDSINNDIGT